MIKIGQKVRFRPSYRSNMDEKCVQAQIIWIHPKKRFALLEYEVFGLRGRQKLRECKQMIGGKLVEV